MATKPRAEQQPRAVDPYKVAETVCDGPLNVQFAGDRATIIFTHLRAKTAPLLERGQVDTEAVVRARIVFSFENLVGLRNLLNQLIPDKPPEAGVIGAGGGTTLQ